MTIMYVKYDFLHADVPHPLSMHSSSSAGCASKVHQLCPMGGEVERIHAFPCEWSRRFWRGEHANTLLAADLH
jgi:hypothetical protein